MRAGGCCHNKAVHIRGVEILVCPAAFPADCREVVHLGSFSFSVREFSQLVYNWAYLVEQIPLRLSIIHGDRSLGRLGSQPLSCAWSRRAAFGLLGSGSWNLGDFRDSEKFELNLTTLNGVCGWRSHQTLRQGHKCQVRHFKRNSWGGKLGDDMCERTHPFFSSWA